MANQAEMKNTTQKCEREQYETNGKTEIAPFASARTHAHIFHCEQAPRNQARVHLFLLLYSLNLMRVQSLSVVHILKWHMLANAQIRTVGALSLFLSFPANRFYFYFKNNLQLCTLTV